VFSSELIMTCNSTEGYEGCGATTDMAIVGYFRSRSLRGAGSVGKIVESYTQTDAD